MSARKITRITLAVLLVAAAATGTTVALKRLHPAKRGVPDHPGGARQPRPEDLHLGRTPRRQDRHAGGAFGGQLRST